jgi:hypothetical protein
MDRGSITSGGAKKHPFYQCCQRGRVLDNKTQLKQGVLFCFYQFQRGRMLDMVLALMSKGGNMVNIGHSVCFCH